MANPRRESKRASIAYHEFVSQFSSCDGHFRWQGCRIYDVYTECIEYVEYIEYIDCVDYIECVQFIRDSEYMPNVEDIVYIEYIELSSVGILLLKKPRSAGKILVFLYRGNISCASDAFI